MPVLTPPAKLRSPSPKFRRLLALVWLLCFGLALLSNAGVLYTFSYQTFVAQPAIASLGIQVSRVGDQWLVVPYSPMARDAGVPSEPKLYPYLSRIGDGPAADGLNYREIIQLLRGEEGTEVRLDLKNREPVRLRHAAANRPPVYQAMGRTGQIVRQAIDLVITLFTLFASFVLWRRKFGDPVAVLVAFVLLFMGGALGFLTWPLLDLPMFVQIYVPELAWLALLLLACPAFPTGRFAPAWTRWFLVGVPAGALFFAMVVVLIRAADANPGLLMLGATVGLMLAALLFLILRVEATPAGAERQRLSWAVLGLAIGLLLYVPTLLVHLQFGFVLNLIPDEIEWHARFAAYILNRISIIIITLGLVAPLLGYRLKDGEAAIGRSASYAVATTIVCVVWAGATAATDAAIRQSTSNQAPGLAAGISALIAIIVFAPTKTRALAWAEASFQRALQRLNAIPERIGRWQLGDDPDAMTGSALKALAESVDATSAALFVRSEGTEPRVVGLHGISNADAVVLLEAGKAQAGEGEALRIDTMDYTGQELTLLIGARVDGSDYSRKEKSAIAAIAEALADAVSAVSRRATRNDRLAEAVAGIKARLEGEAGEVPARPGPRPPRRR